MDYRNILATGFLLLCGAVFVQSLKSANAFPQGPNVSMGSNPIESMYGRVNTASGNQDIFTNNSTHTFIVNTLIAGYGSNSCQPTINNSSQNGLSHLQIFNPRSTGGENAFTNGDAKLRIEPGDTIQIMTSGNTAIYYFCDYYFDGYYTH